MATLKDVAKLAKVHPSTVSRVLRDIDSLSITTKTRERILNAVEELKYRPDQMARALKMGKSFSIGLIIPDISNPFFAELVKIIENECTKAGFILLVSISNEDQEKEIQHVNNLLGRGIDGLILAPVQNSYNHILELKSKNFPFLLIDRYFETFETNAIISDNEESAFKAVQYLVKLGHNRIGFISGRPEIYTIRKRLEGFKKALKEFNLEDNKEFMWGAGHTFQDGYEATQNLLALNKPPTALLISGNLITLGAYKALLEKGLHIPNDISIIAFSDNVISQYLSTPLTTISHPLEEMGKRAFQLLFQNINTEVRNSYTKITVCTNFIIRESTGKRTS